MWLWLRRLLFSQGRLLVDWLRIAATRALFNYRTYKPNNHSRSIDAHFQDAAGSMMLLFWISKAANTSFMNGCVHSPLRLPKMHSQKSLIICWCSFSEWGSERMIYSFAKRRSQNVGYEWHRPHHRSITRLTRLKIVDAPLTLILMYCLMKICCH